MVLPSADNDEVVCTCEDFEAGDVDRHCPLHPHYDTWEIYDEQRQQQIDDDQVDQPTGEKR